jgi:hypothetical protein
LSLKEPACRSMSVVPTAGMHSVHFVIVYDGDVLGSPVQKSI